MVILFILDVITSVSLRIVVNCGTWIAYKSANGAHYLYKKLMPQPPPQPQKLDCARIIDMSDYASTQQSVTPASNDNSDASYVLITRDEYDRLKSGMTAHNHD